MRLSMDIDCGDLVLFSGAGAFSWIIKNLTDRKNHAISHVGVMLSPTLMIEATTLTGENGVTPINLRYKVESYPGSIWVRPLAENNFHRLDRKRFVAYLMSLPGQSYSKLQAVLAPLRLGTAMHNWSSSWYCSKLVACAYMEGGLLPPTFDSAITPAGLAELPIFQGQYQLRGSRKELKFD